MVGEKLVAVVLAAGASSRMGRPKALIGWRGRPFVRHAIELARGAGIERVIVVEGAVPLSAAVGEAARVVHNDVWEEGPLGSLQCGLREALTPAVEGVLVLSVDRPHLEPQTVARLVAAWSAEPEGIWQPSFQGRHGHPIVHPRDVADTLLSLERSASPRPVLRSPEFASRRRFVEVSDPAVLDNLDRPEDLGRLPS